MQPSLTRSQSSRASFDRASLARRLRDRCICKLCVHCRSCMTLVLLKLRFFPRSAKRFLRKHVRKGVIIAKKSGTSSFDLVRIY